MKKTKKQIAADRARVSAIYGRECSGIQIPIFSMPKVMDAGLASIEAGGNDADIAKSIKEVVATVRSN